MAPQRLLLVLFAAQLTAAQVDLGSLLSAAESFVTSVFAPATSTSSSLQTTPTSTTSSSSSSTSTSSSSSNSLTASPSQSAAAVSSPTASSASSAIAAQASQSSASASSHGGGGSSNTLAIVLGCTLGALALAAFLALLLFCRRRRRKSKTTPKHHALSSSDDEAETWHHEKPRVRSLKEPTAEVHSLDDTRANASNMPAYTAFAHQNPSQNHHQNPFVPVPPPARRSMHAGGAHDDTSYSAHPFRPEDVSAYPVGTTSNTAHGHTPDQTNHSNHALAAGAGGAVLGGLAAHAKDRHDRKRSTSRGRVGDTSKSGHTFSEDEHNALPEATPVARRSGSVSRASAKEPWPFMDGQTKKSFESARPDSRGMSHNHDHFSTPNQYPDENHGHSGAAVAGAAAAGGLAGAALTNKSKKRSPHRKGILKQTTSDSSNPSSLTTEDYLPAALSKDSSRPLSSTGPHELATTETPVTSHGGEQYKNSHSHGAAAPLAAAVAVDDITRHRRRSGSGAPHTSTPLPPLVIPQEEDPPVIPSRSPKRTSLEYSRARYSTANEGTAELPSQLSNNVAVSPTIDARRTGENDGLLSPVSPISEAHGSWSKAQAAHTGLGHIDPREKTSSQGSTVVNTSSPDEVLHKDEQSSGLVSAIQRIFNSGRPVSDDHEVLVGNSNADVHSNREKRLRNVTHRKPAPDRASHQPISQYGDFGDQQPIDVMPGAWENTTQRRSGDSARSLPPRYRSRGNSYSNNYDDGFVPAATDSYRNRSHSRPGYGIGSGDPFDLARTRTDSSMTGVSLSNYQEPAANAGRPRSYRKSSGSDYREPTLADLRREVMAEDRERARQSWRNSQSHSRSNSAGLRYGDDRDLFNIIDQTTGQGRYYATGPQERRGSMGGNVGRAF